MARRRTARMDVMTPAKRGYRFAYQPILNAAQASVGVELRIGHRADSPSGGADGNAFATAEAIIHAFIHSGLDDLLRHRRAWVRSSPALLGSGLIDLLPPEHFTLMLDLNQASEPASSLIPRLSQLRLAGFGIAVTVAQLRQTSAGELERVADVLIFDAADWRSLPSVEHLPRPGDQHTQWMARGVDQPGDFDTLRHAGFDLFQGYYFAYRAEAEGSRVDPRKLAVLEILAKLAADADDPELEESFRSDPALALHLLRIVNSSVFALHSRISSIKHAFSVLGRRHLMRWLQVLLFALDGRADGASPLMELALRRGRFVEHALTHLHHQTSSHLQDEAYMTGLLSLADVLVGWPMEKVAEKLHLTEAVKLALLGREGVLGRLLSLSEALEAADFERAGELAASLRLSEDAVINTQNVALAWAHAVTSPPQETGAAD